MPAAGGAMPDIDGRSIAEIVTDTCGEGMRELGIPGEPTTAIRSFAIDIGPEDARWHNDEMLGDAIISPESSSFCRPTAARLFGRFHADRVLTFPTF
jgi:hypothetical protein